LIPKLVCKAAANTLMSNLAKKQEVATEKTATMTVVKEVPANGKTVVIEEAVAEVVVEETKPVEKINPVITLDKRIEKVEELNITIAKWRQLQVARKGINNFRLGADGLSSTLSLKDADGQPFTTSNPVVVEAALSHIRQVLNEKIAEAENEINFSM
jgi:hypothetical protein